MANDPKRETRTSAMHEEQRGVARQPFVLKRFCQWRSMAISYWSMQHSAHSLFFGPNFGNYIYGKGGVGIVVTKMGCGGDSCDFFFLNELKAIVSVLDNVDQGMNGG
eukprot:scaffold1814_cov94-Cylindrotheca_fusiformis.AAC.2